MRLLSFGRFVLLWIFVIYITLVNLVVLPCRFELVCHHQKGGN
jgi:hypothetical protein